MSRLLTYYQLVIICLMINNSLNEYTDDEIKPENYSFVNYNRPTYHNVSDYDYYDSLFETFSAKKIKNNVESGQSFPTFDNVTSEKFLRDKPVLRNYTKEIQNIEPRYMKLQRTRNRHNQEVLNEKKTELQWASKALSELTELDKTIQSDIIYKMFQTIIKHRDEVQKIMNDFPNEVPKCAENYCTDVPNYPKQSLLKALKKKNNLILHNDQIMNDDINLRTGILGSNVRDVRLCDASEFLIFPKTAQNIFNEWFFIVNEESYTQSIKVETCKKEYSPCHIVDSVRLGYEVYCKQTYIIRELITFNKTGDFGKSSFRFPANCCCRARSMFSIRTDSSLDISRKNYSIHNDELFDD